METTVRINGQAVTIDWTIAESTFPGHQQVFCYGFGSNGCEYYATGFAKDGDLISIKDSTIEEVVA